MSDRKRAHRQHGPVKRGDAPRQASRRSPSGGATGAIVRPGSTPRDRRREVQARASRSSGKTESSPKNRQRGRSRYGDHGIASLGEARAYRRLERDLDVQPTAPKRGKRPDPRQRARRTIKTTTPLLAQRFGAGRPRPRLVLTLVVITAVLGTVLAKVGLMQSTAGAALRSDAADQWTRTRVLPAQRGTIFDRNGGELALSVPAATVAVNPRQITDAAGTVTILGDLLDLPDERRQELQAKIEANDSGFVYVKRQVDRAVDAQIDALGLDGVSTYPEDRRMTPGGVIGRSVMGRTDIDGDGIAGLELQYDALLRGTPGAMTLDVAPGGRSIAGTEQIANPAIPGRDIVTTIDRSVQFQTEQVLIDRVATTGALGGQIVVLDTKTGDVIAMVSVDRDDRGGPRVSSGNFAAVGAYEPGSVGKVITLAAALEEGEVTPDTTWTVPWTYDCTIDPTNGILHDAYPHDPIPMSVRDIIVESSNVGTIFISKSIGLERVDRYMRAFGLGERTALDFPGESPGIFKTWEDWTGTERCTIPYGQGLSSTPIQLAAAVNVIANDGVYVAPRLVSATVSADGQLVEADAPEARRVISQATAETVQQIMRGVVCDGTAKAAQVPGLSVGGKTGTAFKAQPDGGYVNAQGEWDYYSSFVGFFPAEDPQVTVLISLDEPQSGYNSGAQAAAPVFKQIVPTIRNELGIVPPPGSTGCDGT